MCLSNFEGIMEPTDREREKTLSCFRCGRGHVFIHRLSGRFQIQCAGCCWAVFGGDFEAAREDWERLKVA